MKRHYKRFEVNVEREKHRKIRNEQKGGFTCSHCRGWVVINEYIGTANRNHCNMCLWSKHVDEKKGDRKALCQAGMKPIGLTFRIEGINRRGEIMLIHDCAHCQKLSINRLAADDCQTSIMAIFEASSRLSPVVKQRLAGGGIYLAAGADKHSILIQLVGYEQAKVLLDPTV